MTSIANLTVRTFHAAALCFGLAAANAFPAAAKPNRFPVIGYFPSWTGMGTEQIRYDKFTHIYYAFANPTPEGDVTGINAKLLQDLVRGAHEYFVAGVNVLILGSVSADPGYLEMLCERVLPAIRRG